MFVLCTGFLPCAENPDFSTYPEYLEWHLESLYLIPGESRIICNFGLWGVKCFGIFYYIDLKPAKQNTSWDLFRILSWFKLEKPSCATEKYAFLGMELKGSSYESHKSPTNHFFRDSLLFCHQELRVLIRHGETCCASNKTGYPCGVYLGGFDIAR